MNEHLTLIATLRNEFDTALADLVPAGPVALLDYPNHANVGDAAIWLGELAWLERTHRSVAYGCTFATLEPERLRESDADMPILLHGGGNFGDIWQHHQRFRETVIALFPDRRIVQLPQSIHYRDPANAATIARLIERHRDFTLLVRDSQSLAFARAHFPCEVRLCPDAAFQLGPQARTPPLFDVLALLRTDDERVGGADCQASAGVRVEDWLEESRSQTRARAALAYVAGSLRGGPDAARLRRYTAVAQARVTRGLRQLSRARALVTDRLHGHILATLLGVPQALLDNEYGKIGRFLDAFSGGTGLTYRAGSLGEAVDWARAAAGSERAAA